MNFNKAIILGNVTRDPEIRSIPSGQQVASFSIATNRYYTTSSGEKKEEAEFHNIVCFGKLADISARYLKKGSLILIEGRIKTRNWTNQAGAKQYRTEIIAETMQLGPRGANSGGSTPSSGGNYGSKPASEDMTHEDIPVIEESYTPPSNISLGSDAGEIDVKDIPF